MSEKLIRVYINLLISIIITFVLSGMSCAILSYLKVCEIERMVTEIREQAGNLISTAKTGDYTC